MDTETMDAFMTLQSKACGLEETFLRAGSELVLTEEDEFYARDACEEILEALDLIRNNT